MLFCGHVPCAPSPFGSAVACNCKETVKCNKTSTFFSMEMTFVVQFMIDLFYSIFFRIEKLVKMLFVAKDLKWYVRHLHLTFIQA